TGGLLRLHGWLLPSAAFEPRVVRGINRSPSPGGKRLRGVRLAPSRSPATSAGNRKEISLRRRVGWSFISALVLLLALASGPARAAIAARDLPSALPVAGRDLPPPLARPVVTMGASID